MTAAQHSITRAARWLKHRATAHTWIHGDRTRISPAISLSTESYPGMTVR